MEGENGRRWKTHPFAPPSTPSQNGHVCPPRHHRGRGAAGLNSACAGLLKSLGDARVSQLGSWAAANLTKANGQKVVNTFMQNYKVRPPAAPWLPPHIPQWRRAHAGSPHPARGAGEALYADGRVRASGAHNAADGRHRVRR